MAERELHCDTCDGVQLFEAPPCVDGHGSHCPELLCTRCGTAVLTPALPRHPRRHRRHPTPHAA